MTIKELSKYARELSTILSFESNKNTIYRKITYNKLIIICGVHFNQTSCKEIFNLEYFIQPLFIPKQVISLSLGESIGNGWDSALFHKNIYNIANMIKDVDFSNSFSDIIEALVDRKLRYWGGQEREWEFLAYMYAAIGDIENSILNIDHIINSNLKYDWLIELTSPIKNLKQILLKGSSKECINMLLSYQEQTTFALKFNI